MTAYCVSYYVESIPTDYTDLIEALLRTKKWWHFLEHTWLIATDETREELRDRLMATIDKKSWLLVIEVNNNVFGNLPDNAWKWIKETVPTISIPTT